MQHWSRVRSASPPYPSVCLSVYLLVCLPACPFLSPAWLHVDVRLTNPFFNACLRLVLSTLRIENPVISALIPHTHTHPCISVNLNACDLFAQNVGVTTGRAPGDKTPLQRCPLKILIQLFNDPATYPLNDTLNGKLGLFLMKCLCCFHPLSPNSSSVDLLKYLHTIASVHSLTSPRIKSSIHSAPIHLSNKSASNPFITIAATLTSDAPSPPSSPGSRTDCGRW